MTLVGLSKKSNNDLNELLSQDTLNFQSLEVCF